MLVRPLLLAVALASPVVRQAEPAPAPTATTPRQSTPEHAAPQQPSPQQTPTTSPPQRPLDATTAEALDRLATVLAERRSERQRAMATPGSPAAAELDAEVQKLELQFASLAAQLEVADFEKPTARSFDLQQELEQLIRPLLKTLKDATAGPRQVSDLRGRIEQVGQRLATAEAAKRAVERTRDQLPPDAPARAEAERELAQRWRPLVARLYDELLVLRANLLRLEDDDTSLLGNVTDAVRQFLQSSGLSLLLTVGVFVVVFFGLRSLTDRLLRRRGERGFSLRLLEVLLRILVVVAAIAGALVVPYVRNDWLLLALGIVFLTGAGWVLVRTLPQFFEQMRLLLNVGGVREGERLLVDGLPFRIQALRFYTRLENPDLQGGVLRVPLQFLVGKRSRASAPDEPWFPTRVGDVVLLADGTFGPVRTQTPETVVVEHWGSARSLPTAEFLKLSPRNLSRGFVADAQFVLGRTQEAKALDAVLAQLAAALRADLAQFVPADQIAEVAVVLQNVTPIGVELLATARCDGASAQHFFALRRRMQHAFVDACRQHGYPLPTAATIATAS